MSQKKKLKKQHRKEMRALREKGIEPSVFKNGYIGELEDIVITSQGSHYSLTIKINL